MLHQMGTREILKDLLYTRGTTKEQKKLGVKIIYE